MTVVQDEILDAIIEESIKLIETYGWVQEQSGAPECGFCMSGAFWYAWENIQGPSDYRGSREYWDEFSNRIKAFSGDPSFPTTSEYGYSSFHREDRPHIPRWNDRKGRTKEEVLRVLEKSIKGEL